MRPDEHNPNGFMVVYIGEDGKKVVCFNTFRYKAAKRYKDGRVAREQRSKYRNRYYIQPMTRKDRIKWKSLPF